MEAENAWKAPLSLKQLIISLSLCFRGTSTHAMGEDVGVGLLAGSNTTSGVPIEHLDYRYVGECKNSKELEKILKVLRWVMVDFNIWILFSFLQVLCKDLIFIKFSLPCMAEVEVACIQRHHVEIMYFIDKCLFFMEDARLRASQFLWMQLHKFVCLNCLGMLT